MQRSYSYTDQHSTQALMQILHNQVRSLGDVGDDEHSGNMDR